MGEQWWLLVGGAAVWSPMLIAAYWHFRHGSEQVGCTECGHEAGLDGAHCADVEDDNGWSSSVCRCQNDYHWNYESTAV